MKLKHIVCTFVAALVAGGVNCPQLTAADPAPEGKIRVLLVTGVDYKGHKWQETAPVLKQQLEKDARLKVQVEENPAALAGLQADKWDVVVMHFKNYDPLPAAAGENLKKFVADGKGLVLVHFACGAWQDWPEFVTLAGRVWNPKLRGHDPRGPFHVDIAKADHPITEGMQGFDTEDELYTCLEGNTPIEVLAKATSKVDHKDYPMAFVLNYGKGRVFHSVLGHDVKAFSFDGVAKLYQRATVWAAGQKP